MLGRLVSSGCRMDRRGNLEPKGLQSGTGHEKTFGLTFGQNLFRSLSLMFVHLPLPHPSGLGRGGDDIDDDG